MNVVTTQNRFARWKNLGSTLALAALACLSACGGGDSDTEPTERAAVQGLQASTTTVYQVTSKNRFAVASYFETSACVTMSLQIFASEDRTRSGAIPTVSTAFVSAELVTVDWCAGGVQTVMSGRQDTKASRFLPDLTQVTATAVIEMKDDLGSVKTLAVDLAWNGGELTADASKTMLVTPITRTLIKSESQIRMSETVTGSLVIDGIDLLAPDRPTPGFIQGHVVSGGSLSVEITHN